MERSEKFWNPYLAGIALGLVLLTTFLVMGRGLGASGAANRLSVAAAELVAPAHVQKTPALSHFTENGKPLDDWLVFEIFGVFLGGLLAAYSAGRLKLGVLKGPRISTAGRVVLALLGGILMGFFARLTRGCMSGQALSGGALLSVGSWVFMFSFFGGGYLAALFVRRQWR
jgi:uncharacterized membrane protein YedE/YeeE